MAVLILFFCSGATALVYEVIWSKYLSLLFGSTIQAQTVVLAAFMGGLALGNRLFGRRADRSLTPLALYGYLEVTIGLYAFFFSSIYRGADWVFVHAGSKLIEHSAWLLVLKGLLSAGLLLGPTILMGGTLPVLAAWLQKSMPDAGRRSARFYSVNSLGAVCGAGLAGFVLVTWIGLPVTLQLTALVNVLIGFTAVGIARYDMTPVRAPESRPGPAGTGRPASSSSRLIHVGCLLVALTGAVSMGLEVLASRCLTLIFGASLQAFSIVLMAFILGIGIGSAIIASPRRARWPNELTTTVLVLGAAGWIGLLVFNIEGLVELYRNARMGFATNPAGYRYHQAMNAVFSIFVLGIPAAALGSVLPLWIRAVSEGSELLGDQVGRLLTWNTLGAVGGVLLSGFVLMPVLGLRGSFTALALVLAVAAFAVAWVRQNRIGLLAAATVGALLILVSASGGAHWRLILSSGVFRRRDYEQTSLSIRELRDVVSLVYYQDAADATVSVEKIKDGVLALRINGKVDASSYGDLSTQFLLTHLPLMMRPESKDVFVFGMGSGISAGAALGYPIDHLVVAENCAPVLRAAHFFDPWNNGVLTNSRVRIYDEDARTVLKLSPQLYDVVIAEPSNPWTVGVGSVFSREFYQIAASRLKPGGIMAQWFHIYDMNDDIVEMVIRTFSAVFPSMEIWETCRGDIIMLGSEQPWKSDVEVYQRVLSLEGPRADLAAIGLTSPAMIMARQLASQRTAFAIPGPGRIQSDDFPLLEYDAPKAFFVGQRAQGLCQFDERTMQASLASVEKQSQLAGLDSERLQSIFGGRYESMDSQLQSFVSVLYNQPDVAKFDCFGGGITLPCLFGVNRRATMQPPLWVQTNDVARELFKAELALQSGTNEQSQAAGQIQSILEKLNAEKAVEQPWSAAWYAGIAAKNCLSRGDAEQAKKIVLRGLQLDPSSTDLQYLSRILMRLGVLEPGDLATAK